MDGVGVALLEDGLLGDGAQLPQRLHRRSLVLLSLDTVTIVIVLAGVVLRRALILGDHPHMTPARIC